MDNKLSHLPDISTIQPDRLIKYRVSEDRFSAEVLLPGFAYTDFDQKIGGKLNLWSLAKMFECIRFAVLRHGFCYYDELRDKDHSIFMASIAYEFTDQGNRLTSHVLWGVHFPIIADVNITYAGTSSLNVSMVLRHAESGEHLIRARVSSVYMDTTARKPAKFPDWFVERKKCQIYGSPQPRLCTPGIPDHAFSFHIVSSFSDIDNNGHINNSIFVKWCTDAGTEAAMKGCYSCFTQNIGKYPMERMDLKYTKEGKAAEQFVIHTWQDTSYPLVLNFLITKDKQVAFVAKFSYKSGDRKANL